MKNITGVRYRVNGKNNETKRGADGKVSVITTSVQKAMSSDGSATTEVMVHP